MQEFFVIEHPTRGFLKEFDWEDFPALKLRFTQANMADEPTEKFFHITPALAALDKARAAGYKDVDKLKIRRRSDGHTYCAQCGGWWHPMIHVERGHEPGCPVGGL